MVFDVKPIVSPKPTDCGATCMQMLLAYYGIEVDLETLIADCKTGFMGCTGADLLRAGRKYGLEMRAWRELGADEEPPAEAETIDVDITEQDRPAIVWWMYNHWCVYCGKDENGKIVICNPDRGRYRMSESTFRTFYTDICITNGKPKAIKEGENNDEG